MLRKDLSYSQASQPIAQYFQMLATRMRLLRVLIKSQNGFSQYSNKFDTVSIIETRMRFELIWNGFASRCLKPFSHLVLCNTDRIRMFRQVLYWVYRSTQHDAYFLWSSSSALLVKLPYQKAENKGIEPSSRFSVNSLSRRAQQTSICLFSIAEGVGVEPTRVVSS